MKINPESNERLFRLELEKPFILVHLSQHACRWIMYRGKERINYYPAASGPYFSVNLHTTSPEKERIDQRIWRKWQTDPILYASLSLSMPD